MMLVCVAVALSVYTNKPAQKGGSIVAQADATPDVAQCAKSCEKLLDEESMSKYIECQNACIKPALDKADDATASASKVIACVGKCGDPLKVTAANAAQCVDHSRTLHPFTATTKSLLR